MKLSFNQLGQELQVLEHNTLTSLKGGQGSSDIQWKEDENGNLFWRDGANGQWQAYQINIGEVTITPSEGYNSDSNPFNGFFRYTGFGDYGSVSESNLWSGSAVTGYTGMVFEKNAALLKLTANQASELADIARALKATKVMVIAGKSLGVIGSVFTAYEGATDGNGLTWGDGLKVGIGIAATFTPFGWAYAVIDLGTGIITGTTLTDRFGKALDGAIE